MKTFYDCGDLENKVKVKLAAHNKRSYHYASWVYIANLYLVKCLLIYGYLSVSLVVMETLTWTHTNQHDVTVTIFWVCLVGFTRGVHRSNMGLLSPVVSKLYAHSVEAY